MRTTPEFIDVVLTTIDNEWGVTFYDDKGEPMNVVPTHKEMRGSPGHLDMYVRWRVQLRRPT